MSDAIPRLVLTPGEPAGIGPDVAIMASSRELPCRLAVIGDPKLLRERAAALDVPVTITDWKARCHRPGTLAVITKQLEAPCRPGQLNCSNAPYVLAALDYAAGACAAGEFDAMVTGPVHKGVINDAGIEFSGHTEYLARRLDVDCPVMLLTSGRLRVALATTHIPLARVSEQITQTRLERVLRVLATDLDDRLGVVEPRIAVCSLNPHVGEGGHLGHEENEVILPVLARLRQDGLRVFGPLAADTIFAPVHLERYDVVLAMYHDQGLPVVKYAAFGRSVNITLGLPIIRTSVDHGTALDLAGTRRADPSSLLAAIDTAKNMALRMAEQHRPTATAAP